MEYSYTKAFDADGGVPEPFPMQVLKSMQEGANHLGGDEQTPDVDPDREFWPAGQGVGAIDELVPAGELVHRFVAEAEQAMGVLSKAFSERARPSHPALELLDELDGIGADRRDVEDGHAALLVGGEPVPHVALGAAQRGGFEQLVRD